MEQKSPLDFIGCEWAPIPRAYFLIPEKSAYPLLIIFKMRATWGRKQSKGKVPLL